MPSGVKIKDVEVGTGLCADRNSLVVIHVRGFLKRGEVFWDTCKNHGPIRVELGKRDCTAGLRYGIVGMREGGRRELVVSPHLGYGNKGLPGQVPPDAVLRFEVVLLEVREPGTSTPEDWPSGKRLYFFWPGEALRNRPRIQFNLEDDGRCGVILTVPQPRLTWRYAKTHSIEHHVEKAECNALFDEVDTIQKDHPEACLNNDQLWADASEKANSVTRDSLTDAACITIGVSERGVWQCYYSLRKTDPILQRSKLYRLVESLIPEHSPPTKGK